MQPEPESDVTSAHDVVRETEPETQDSGYESVEQAAFNKKKVPELEPAVEQAICEWFADHPLFYDMGDANFKNRQRKDRLLDQKGKELNVRGKVSSSGKYSCGYSTQLLLLFHLKPDRHKFESSWWHSLFGRDLNPQKRSHVYWSRVAKDRWYHQS